MGLRFRKSINAGPLRVNLSKSGVGFSAGVKGFRATKKANGGYRTTASIPGTGLSYAKESGSLSNGSSSSAYSDASGFAPSSGTGQNTPQKPKNKVTEFVLCLLLGWCGAHRFYMRKFKTAILYLFTFGCLGIGWLGDTIILLLGFLSKGRLTQNKIAKPLAYVLSFLLFMSPACGGSDSPVSPTEPSLSLSATEVAAPSAESQASDFIADTASPSETDPQSTVPLATTPPATDPPAALVTNPSVTEPPATAVPQTDPPATIPPATEATGIVFVSWPETTSRNRDATVTIKGAPNTTYSITVYYKSGASTADGLEDKTSDANGNVSWTWHIGGKTSPGTFRIVVSGGGDRETVEFTIVE